MNTQLGTIDDFYAMVSVFKLLLYFVSPWLILFISVYICRRIVSKSKNKHKLKQQEKLKQQALAKQKEVVKQNSKVQFDNDKYMLSKLNDIQEPIRKDLYRSLDIEFDINGKMKG